MLGIGGITKAVAQRIALRAAAPFGGITTEAGEGGAGSRREAATPPDVDVGRGRRRAKRRARSPTRRKAPGRDYKDYARRRSRRAWPPARSRAAPARSWATRRRRCSRARSKAGNVTGSLPGTRGQELRQRRRAAGDAAVRRRAGDDERRDGQGRPHEGVGNQAAMGLVVTGGAMGAGEGAFAPHHANAGSSRCGARAERCRRSARCRRRRTWRPRGRRRTSRTRRRPNPSRSQRR
jgi:hypothetical protein